MRKTAATSEAQIRAEATGATLARCFERIHRERMQDVPILNPALSVAALGFRPWSEFSLGMLLTPWFLNLVLVPRQQEQFSLPRSGKTVTIALPAGKFDFMSCHEEEAGAYLSCSLLSPVHELTDQSIAEETANEVLAAIMTPPAQAAARQAAAPTPAASPGATRRSLFTRFSGAGN